MTPDERSLRGRIGAFALHSKGGTNTGPARVKFLSRFEKEVDPNRVLSNAERVRRAESARKAYFTRLALKSVQARRKKRNSSPCRGRGVSGSARTAHQEQDK